MSIFGVFIGLLIIIAGILSLNKSTAEKFIRWRNAVEGIQTKITSLSIQVIQIGGIIAIIGGLVLIAIALGLIS